MSGLAAGLPAHFLHRNDSHTVLNNQNIILRLSSRRAQPTCTTLTTMDLRWLVITTT